MNDALLIRREGNVLILSNNNVAARNALSPEFYAAVTTALADAAADASIGAVILTGEAGISVLVAICASWPSAASCPWSSAAKSWKACTT